MPKCQNHKQSTETKKGEANLISRSVSPLLIVKNNRYYLFRYLSTWAAIFRPLAMALTTRLAPLAASPATNTLSANSGCCGFRNPMARNTASALIISGLPASTISGRVLSRRRKYRQPRSSTEGRRAVVAVNEAKPEPTRSTASQSRSVAARNKRKTGGKTATVSSYDSL